MSNREKDEMKAMIERLEELSNYLDFKGYEKRHKNKNLEEVKK